MLADQLAIGRTGTPSAVAAALSSGSGDDGAGPNGGSMYGNGGSSAAYQASGRDGGRTWDTVAAAGLGGHTRALSSPAAGHLLPCWCLAPDVPDALRGRVHRRASTRGTKQSLDVTYRQP